MNSKKSFISEWNKFILSEEGNERHLYHGTITDYKKSIEDIGVIGDIGDWVKDAYGCSIDFEDEELGGCGKYELIFAADKKELDKCVGAMRFHIGKKLGIYMNDVTEDMVKEYGMLIIFHDIEVGDYDDYSSWRRNPGYKDMGYYETHPMTTEPGDYYFEGSTTQDVVMTGNKMMKFLRRNNALSDMPEDSRRLLIKLAVKKHGPEKRKEILRQVKELSAHEVRKMMSVYKSEMV